MEQFINGLNDETITAEITKELLTALKDTSEVSSDQVLNLGQEGRSAKSAEGSIRQYRRCKRFDSV